MTTFLRLLLALASIVFLPIYGCTTPDGSTPDDDDGPVATDDDDVECTVEALAAIEGASVYAEKSDGSAVLADCTVTDGICSMLAPAGVELEIYGEATNVVSCVVTTTLEPAAAPHEIEVPLGYGGPSHVYNYIGASGSTLGTYQVETACQDGKVIVNTHGAGRWEVVGDQLVDIDQVGTTGSVNADLSVYTMSTGGRFERQP